MRRGRELSGTHAALAIAAVTVLALVASLLWAMASAGTMARIPAAFVFEAAGPGAADTVNDGTGSSSAAPVEAVPVVSVPAPSAPAPQPVSSLVPVPPPPPPPPPPTRAAKSAPRDAPAAGQQSAPGTAPVGAQQPEACDVGAAEGSEQVVVVRSSGSRATVRACSRTENGSYVTDLGPFSGYVGRSGVVSAGAKREGDGATPAGVYPLRGGFGLRGNPGLPQGWFVVDGNDVWVDDPASALYNTHQRGPADGRWASAEPLANAPAYHYAQVIGYNESARPGAGSAIFLHVSTGGATAGCVSLPTSALLEVMRWERSGAVIAIS